MKKNSNFFELAVLEALFSELNSAVILLDGFGKILYLNPSSERILKSSLRFARGASLADFWGEENALSSLVEEVLKTGRTLKAHEIELSMRSGPIFFQIEIAPIEITNKKVGVLMIFDELSMLKALREESRVLDRLSMMGTLASGLAHEIRNPLGGIRAAAEMLQRESQSSSSLEYVPMIISEVDRVNHLVTQLLDFAKPKKIDKAALNINQLLSELLVLQKLEMEKRGISLKQEFDPSLPPMEGHKASLHQAFLNIIKNAIEAMGSGGLLKISTGVNYEHRMIVGEGRPIPMLQVVITDTGPGISDADLQSLFTPFFTTKPQGTGLGLMMTQRILKEHEGLLRITTEVGRGSSFKILLKLLRS